MSATPSPSGDLAAVLRELPDGAVRWYGRIASASNLTLLGEIEGIGLVVHKPVAGERPLWDYPDGTLAAREVAAWSVSDALGLGLVPETAWVDDLGFGPGAVQRWFGSAPWADDGPDGHEMVDVVDAARLEQLDAEGADWHVVLEGLGETGEPVWLVHRDTERLRSLALFDAMINNSDRKGGHVLTAGEDLRGIDHGVSFSPEPKLRTVLWGWAEAALTDAEREVVTRGLSITDTLADHLTDAEVEAWGQRLAELLAQGRFPSPGTEWPAVPWPPF